MPSCKVFLKKVGVIVLRKFNPSHSLFLKKNNNICKKINYDLAVHGIVVQMAEKNLIYFVTQQFKLKTDTSYRLIIMRSS